MKLYYKIEESLCLSLLYNNSIAISRSARKDWKPSKFHIRYAVVLAIYEYLDM